MILALALSAAFLQQPDPTFAWMPRPPGPAKALASAGEVSVENNALKVAFDNGRIVAENRWTGERQDFGQGLFRIVLRDGRAIVVAPGTRRSRLPLRSVPNATRAVEREGGYTVVIPATVATPQMTAYWRLVLRDNANYARIEVGLATSLAKVDIKEVDLLRFRSPVAQVSGKVSGSPIVAGGFFCGVEHPMSVSTVSDGVATCAMMRALPLRPGSNVSYSAVIGVAPSGQMRRGVLAYAENERAHPYRPFLHYNNWLDTAFGRPFSQAECLDRIEKFGKELIVKRGVSMDSFLFDDGWDNTQSVWQFHSGFPRGFLPLAEAAAQYGAGVGVWLSPWGGYGTAREQRLAYGRAHGMEVDSQGYALSGPKYYKIFHDVTMDFVTRQGINQFKFDGTGSPDKMTPGSRFDSDFDAAISLIRDLRSAKPGLFINLTTGTWPSPFWLLHADSTWRGGADSSFAGVGTKRQQWITYRDGDTYHGVVLRGSLYPLNSLMIHGILYARHAGELSADPGNDLADEIHSYFGSGTQLQELYITPDLLTAANWDDLAQAAKWSRDNADVLRDTHWVGGDPTKLEVYGWASWSPRKSILVLRNPSDKPQAFSVDIDRVLELPANSAENYVARSPWPHQYSVGTFKAGRSTVVDLKPFEVQTYELLAAPGGVIKAATSSPVPSQNQGAKPIPVGSGPLRVACLGASIVAGVGTSDKATKSYPAQLQRLLGTGYAVGNFGHSGATLSRETDAPYWTTQEYRQALQFNPNLVVIMLGTNDATKARWPKVKDDFVPQYKERIETLRSLSTRPKIFICIPPANFEERRQNIEEAVIPLVKQVARETGVGIVDLFTPLEGKTELFPDRLHPNDEGTGLLAQAVAEAIDDPAARKQRWRVVSVDSEEQGEGAAKQAIDGDPYTYWHTNYSEKLTKHPHEIVVDMGSEQEISAFRHLPRQDGGINGRVRGFEIYVSSDGQTWGAPVASGEIPDVFGWTAIPLATPARARYFKFRALSEWHKGPWTSIGELDVRKPIHP